MSRKNKKKRKAEPVTSGATEVGQTRPARRFWRYCLVLLLSGVVALAWLSVVSYSPTDPPAPTVSPPKSPVDNAAGRVGAFVAYQLHYWLGGGAYMGLLFASIAAVVMMLGGRISDLPWRVVGLVLLVTTTSAAVYLINPSTASDPYAGSAGVLGISRKALWEKR